MTTSSYESLSHSKWDCKYHGVLIPKGRKKALYGKIRQFLGPVLREFAGQRGSTIVEGHIPTTPLSLALCLSALPMREIRLVIAPLDPGHEGEALLNRIRMQG